MPITKDTFLESIRAAVPEFAINPEWVEERLGYPLINDFARYICCGAEVGDLFRIRGAADFLERCLDGGDPYVVDLVSECLETLFSCKSILEMKDTFGAKTLAAWDRCHEDTFRR